MRLWSDVKVLLIILAPIYRCIDNEEVKKGESEAIDNYQETVSGICPP